MAKKRNGKMTERQLCMIEMRAQGNSYTDIGAAFGITGSGARDNIRVAARLLMRHGREALPDSIDTPYSVEDLIASVPNLRPISQIKSERQETKRVFESLKKRFTTEELVKALEECNRDPEFAGKFNGALYFVSKVTGIDPGILYYDMFRSSNGKDSETLEQNTRIRYLYRDAENNKVWNECVIPGILTPEQQKTILGCLHEVDLFIPSLVGLPEAKFDEVDDPDIDDQWFELDEASFEIVVKRADVPVSPEELVAAFVACKDRWMERYLDDASADTLSQSNTKPSLSEKIKGASARVATRTDLGPAEKAFKLGR